MKKIIKKLVMLVVVAVMALLILLFGGQFGFGPGRGLGFGDAVTSTDTTSEVQDAESSTNKEITIRSTVPYRIGEKEIIRNPGPGSCLINAKLLVDIIRHIEGADISFEVIDDSIAKIDDGKYTGRPNCVKAESYADIDLEPRGTILTIPCDLLTQLVEQSAFAASTKEQRPVLTAVNLVAEDGVLTAMATDSARLAMKSVTIDSDVRFRCNVPAKVLADIIRLFEGTENVTLAVSDNSILFLFDNTVVCSRLIQGEYLVKKSIIPQTFNYFLEVNGQELLSAMARVSLLSSEKESVVKLSMTEDEVEISARSETSGSANENIRTFQFTGERLDVYFNSLLVIDAIRALRCEDVQLCFQAEGRPFIVKNPRDDSAIEFITPMRYHG